MKQKAFHLLKDLALIAYEFIDFFFCCKML